ncbi:hypothetical protein [Clostridium neonatale]|uniref:hypothetical protein n=1 Tax=Clostridium neonatale TaxID=137838 RepID=UPI0029372E81|nr:hypothetical protein [Clostridium neonatale]
MIGGVYILVNFDEILEKLDAKAQDSFEKCEDKSPMQQAVLEMQKLMDKVVVDALKLYDEQKKN